MREIKIGRNQHHPEQQHQRVVVDGAARALRRHYTRRDHQDCAWQGGSRTIQRQNFELAATDQNVGERENDACNDFPLPMIHQACITATSRPFNIVAIADLIALH